MSSGVESNFLVFRKNLGSINIHLVQITKRGIAPTSHIPETYRGIPVRLQAGYFLYQVVF
jgi:hypothetical protein